MPSQGAAERAASGADELDVLLSNETSEAEKWKILQNDYGIQMTQTLETEVSVMCSLSKGVMEK